RQRLERRDVQDRRVIAERPVEPAPDQLVHAGQERRQRLARTGRGRDQDVLPGADLGPPGALRLGRGAEPLAEPACDEWMKRVEDVDHGRAQRTAARCDRIWRDLLPVVISSSILALALRAAPGAVGGVADLVAGQRPGVEVNAVEAADEVLL